MMITIGGKNRLIQKRAPRRNGWTTAARTRFLDVLAATCNVADAARAAGLTKTSARQLRQRDPHFAQLWDEALQLGYARLEEELVAQALGTLPNDDNPTGPRAEIDRPGFDPDLAIKVLTLRQRRQPGAGPVLATAEEVDAIILKRIDALVRRRDKQ